MSDRVFILASQSPRRKEILKRYISDFECIPAHGEEVFDLSLPLDQAIQQVALHKGEEIKKEHPEAIVLAADTIVCFEGKILQKPKSIDEARSTLQALSGNSHVVMTGMALLIEDRILTCTDTTKVHFRSLSPEEIEAYVQQGTCMDKAGSYAIQDTDFVSSIDGSYSNVVGLCTERLEALLKQENLPGHSA